MRKRRRETKHITSQTTKNKFRRLRRITDKKNEEAQDDLVEWWKSNMNDILVPLPNQNHSIESTDEDSDDEDSDDEDSDDDQTSSGEESTEQGEQDAASDKDSVVSDKDSVVSDNDSKNSNKNVVNRNSRREREPLVVADETLEDLKLSRDQKHALNCILANENILITGPPGNGKTEFMRYFIYHTYNSLQNKKTLPLFHPRIRKISNLAITSTTWNSGTLLHPKRVKSIHSFSGLGYGEETIFNIKLSKSAIKRWKECEVLIIDEVSMLSKDFFGKLDYVARIARESSLVFGGIQIILVGDFMQIPPINKIKGSLPRFCFDCPLFHDNIKVVQLTTNFRQATDTKFTEILNEVRLGELSYSNEELLRKRTLTYVKRQRLLQNIHQPVIELYPRRLDVDSLNLSKMGELLVQHNRYKNRELAERALLQPRLPPTYIKNIDGIYQETPFSRYTIAKIIREGSEQNPITKMDIEVAKKWDRELCSKGMIPSILNLCLHAKVMLVANINPLSGLVNGRVGRVVGFSPPTEIKGIRIPRMYPIVYFPAYKSLEACTQTIFPWKESCFRKRREIALRLQVPLILAYAVTWHKVQGATLAEAIIVGDGFAPHMWYTALSRLRSLQQVHLYMPVFPPAPPYSICKKFYQDQDRRQQALAIEGG